MPRQHQSNIAFPQAGSAGAKRDFDIVLGALDGYPVELEYRDLLFHGGPSVQAYWNDFHGSAGTPENITVDAASTGTSTLSYSTLATATAATLNDHTTAAIAPVWGTNFGEWIVFEARFLISALTTVAVEVGLSDALSETGGLAFSNHTVAGVTDVATDAVVVAFDSAGDAGFNVCSVNNGTPSAVATGVTPVALTYNTVRIAISPTRDAHVFIDNNRVAIVEDAVANNVALGAWITVKALAGAIRSVQVDYLGISQKRNRYEL